MTSYRARRYLFIIGAILFVAFILAAGGAAPRYNRIVFGAFPLAGALISFGAAAYCTGRAAVRPRIALAALLWLSAAVVIAVWCQPSLAGSVPPDPRIERAHPLLTLTRDRLRQELFAELQPVELQNCQLERFGDEHHDGGYLICGNLLTDIRAAYSYGIEGRDEWGCEVANRFSVRVHQYDCFDVREPVCLGGETIFHAECVGPARRVDESSRVFDSVKDQLTRNGDGSNRVLIKMDVEGAEWATLAETPDDVLQRTDQLVIELHGIGLQHQLAVVRRLKQFFHVAHLHFNNITCTERLDPFPAWVYEVLFVNKRIAGATGRPAVRPHALDVPNWPEIPDCQAATTRWSHTLPGALRFQEPE